jgi:hypothetical protein
MIVLTLVSSLAPTLGAFAADDPALEGRTIVRIVFDRHNIFDTADPKTSAWPYRAANSLHITSREGFLRSMLLFEEGDPYSAAAAEESARLLRSLGFINPVYITAAEVEGGVEVTVETRDQWSLQVGADAGLSGSRGSYGFQLQEENLLGWGKELTLSYESDVERDGWGIRYRDPNIAGSRWTANLAYEDRSDGSLERVLVERPFYALHTARAWGGWWESELLTEYLYSESESVVEGVRDTRIVRGWFGARLPGAGAVTRRLTLGWEHQRRRYGDWRFDDTGDPYPAPDDLDVSGPRIGYAHVTDNYEVVTGFRAWSAQEDIALGPNFDVNLTWSEPGLGGDIRRLLVDGSLHLARHRGRWLVLGDAWVSGRIDDGDARNLVIGAQAAASQIGDRGFQFRLLWEDSRELDTDRQLTLGTDVGLRGWDPDYFDGTGRALANAQYRRLLFRDVLELFSVGALVFVDAGRTWGARVGPSTDGIRTDAGVGLIFDLSRFSTSNILRAEIAWPDDGSGYVISLTGSSLF